ncbi:MAG TPA: EthD domain-containing protein [Acidimicrobiia bacterium]
MSTTKPDDVRARAVVVVAAGSGGPTPLAAAVRRVGPLCRARVGSGGSIRIGTRRPDDPLAAVMGERAELEPVDAVIELTAAGGGGLADAVGFVDGILATLDDTADPLRSAVIVGSAHRFLAGDGALFVALAGRRDSAISIDELSRWWLEQHGPLALALADPLPRAYEQLHADGGASAAAAARAGVPARGYDMCATISVDSMSDLAGTVMDAEVGAKLFEDELGHVDHAHLRGAVQDLLVV